MALNTEKYSKGKSETGKSTAEKTRGGYWVLSMPVYFMKQFDVNKK